MSSTTIARGNVQSSTVIQYTLGVTAIAAGSAEVSITVSDVQVGNIVLVSSGFANTTGVALVNARVTAANTIALGFINTTGSSANTIAGTYYLQVVKPENLPVPSSPI
jgi:hypothetical protein